MKQEADTTAHDDHVTKSQGNTCLYATRWSLHKQENPTKIMCCNEMVIALTKKPVFMSELMSELANLIIHQLEGLVYKISFLQQEINKKTQQSKFLTV